MCRKFDVESFGKRLLSLRIGKDIDAKKLGKALGVTHQTIYRWENGTRRPTIDNIFEIADFFVVSVTYLLGLSEK